VAIVEHRDRLGAGDRHPPAGAAHDFGDGGEREIFSAGDFVSLLNDPRIAVLEGSAGIDLGTVFAVGEQTIPVRIGAGGDGRAVDVGGGGINGVMLGEGDAFAREFPKGGRIALGDEVGTHAVPDDDDDVAVVWRRRCLGEEGGSEEAG
jgi:hypothetical protein